MLQLCPQIRQPDTYDTSAAGFAVRDGPGRVRAGKIRGPMGMDRGKDGQDQLSFSIFYINNLHFMHFATAVYRTLQVLADVFLPFLLLLAGIDLQGLMHFL